MQRGWTLLESAVTMALLAAIAVLVLSTLTAIERQDAAVESTADLERAEDAIFGFAMTQARFPALYPGGVVDSAPLMRPTRTPAPDAR